jgi:Putative transposase
LPVPYYHVVFTLPAPIGAIAYTNKDLLYGLLFDIAAETLRTIAADPKHLGARIGTTLVLHTWGSALTHHPHVHGIVPGGGLALDTERWVSCKPGFFLSVRVLSRLFRRRFLEELENLHRHGQLKFFGDHVDLADAEAFADWLMPLRQCEWVVYAKRPFAGPEAVLAYLSRYTHRVAIFQLTPRGIGRSRRHVPLEGLPRTRSHPLQNHDRSHRGVHAPLPAAHAALWLPSHPPLRFARQRQPQARRRHRTRAAASAGLCICR